MIAGMEWIDGHVDLAYLEVHGRNIEKKCDLADEACISLPDFVDSPVRTIFGTICTYPKDGPCGYTDSSHRDAAFQAGLEQLQIYQRLERDGHITIELQGCPLKSQLSTLLLMEGADPIRSADDVQWWREQGLRCVGLTWAIGTRYAGGNACGGPLTDEGIELIAALDEAGIAHDVSHLSDDAFEDVLHYAKGQIIASHSNSRSVLENDSQRHLKDDQASEIFARGGVIGLNLCNQFLSKNFSNENTTASISDCVEHILHWCDLAGNRRQIALGSDFDGGFSTKYLPEHLKHPNQLSNLAEALRSVGFDEDDLTSFANSAWMRVFS